METPLKTPEYTWCTEEYTWGDAMELMLSQGYKKDREEGVEIAMIKGGGHE